MKIIYPPFGYQIANETKFVIKGKQGNGFDADNNEAVIFLCTQLIDDVNFIATASHITHAERLMQLQKFGFQIFEESLPGKGDIK